MNAFGMVSESMSMVYVWLQVSASACTITHEAPGPHLVKNNMSVLSHVLVLNQLLQQDARGAERQPRVFGDAAVHGNLVADKTADLPVALGAYSSCDAHCSNTTRLGDDDIAVLLFIICSTWVEHTHIPGQQNNINIPYVRISIQNFLFYLSC